MWAPSPPRVYSLASVSCPCLHRTLSLKSLKPSSLFVCVCVHLNGCGNYWRGSAHCCLEVDWVWDFPVPTTTGSLVTILVGKRLIGKEKRWKAQRTLMLQLWLRHVGFFFFLKAFSLFVSYYVISKRIHEMSRQK